MSRNFLCCQKPLPPLSSTDEERQLQLALALSKEEHEKVPVSCSPGSALLALGLLSVAPEPKASPRSGARFAFAALGCLLSALPGGSALEELSAQMLGLFRVAAPVLGVSPREGAGCRVAELTDPIPCPCRK